MALIVGDTDQVGSDSNGAGKSALFDCIAWALFGKTIRKIGKDDVIRFGEKNAKVVLHFDVEGVKYRVRRYRGSNNSLELHCKAGKDVVDMTEKTPSLTQLAVERLVGMDFETFLAVAYYAQKHVSAFADGSSKDRLDIVGKILGLSALDNASAHSRKRLGALTASIELKKGLLERVLEVRSELDERDLRSRRKALRQEKESCASELASAVAVLEEAAEVDRLLCDRQSLVSQHGRLKAPHKAECERLESSILHEEKKAEEKGKLEVQIMDLERSVMTAKAVNDALRIVSDEIHVLQSDMSAAETRRTEQLCQRKNLIAAASKRGSCCPTCGREIDKATAGELQARAEERDADAHSELKLVKRIRKKLEVLGTKSIELRERQNRIKEDEKALAVLRVQHSGARGALERAVQLTAQLDESKQKYRAARAKLKEQAVRIDRQLQDRDETDIECEGQRELVEALRQRSMEYERDLATIEEKLNQVGNLKAEINGYKTQLEALNNEAGILDFWVKGFPRIKLLIVDSFIPEFEQQVNLCLAALAPRVRMRFETLVPLKGGGVKEKFEIFVTDVHTGRTTPWDGWSGGEKKRVALALYMGLNSVASRAMASRIEFLLLDEVLADLDVTGRQAALDLLEQERDTDRSIFLISHLPGLHARFGEIITVKKRDDVSTIQE